MKVKNGFVMRDVAGQTVIIATGEASRAFQGMIRVNETGRVIWQGLSDGLSVDDIVANITSKFDVDQAKATADVTDFVDQMRANGFLDE
ncbi:coenzyme PQQ synthesis protein [Bifidobacterium hapali]|uniref:Coenzyme PQQ synthesis protein n=1 Tax=Bifidobacterium hapali TaxID=1630172 RepID=A0A261FSF8_9BIFI|nr:PqqD family protein [Bifidobacterium hapali]OZG62121.1 coenzyme PQQ synthesis protein [Bifidobacterium hapali]